MRLAALVSTVVLAAATSAAAQAPQVNVSIGPDLQKKASVYGQHELDFLASDLRVSVESRLARTGAMPGGRLDLVIVDAAPNHPTPAQFSAKPGLSNLSFGLGGAAVEGVYTAADGTQTPVSYRWYESDLRWARYETTWGDAQTTFDRLGSRLARGDLYAQR